MRFFDTHCHLQDKRITDDCHNIIKKAKAVGVSFFLCCGSNEQDWENVAELSRKYQEIIPAFGLHPWYIENRSNTWLYKLERLLQEFPHASVGEIGLDHALEMYDSLEQEDVFHRQLECAQKYLRPVSIHCRKAWGALVNQISSVGYLKKGGAIHSFSGSPEIAKTLARFGCYFSFSGSITYSNNKRAQKALLAIPLNKLLIETDSPDIPPAGYVGFNNPSTITIVNSTVAVIKGMDEEDIARQIFDNSINLFGFSGII